MMRRYSSCVMRVYGTDEVFSLLFLRFKKFGLLLPIGDLPLNFANMRSVYSGFTAGSLLLSWIGSPFKRSSSMLTFYTTVIFLAFLACLADSCCFAISFLVGLFLCCTSVIID